MSETRTYAVWRQDEGGNLFLVSDGWTSRDDAQAQADAMEAKGRKQTYFVKDSVAGGDETEADWARHG